MTAAIDSVPSSKLAQSHTLKYQSNDLKYKSGNDGSNGFYRVCSSPQRNDRPTSSNWKLRRHAPRGTAEWRGCSVMADPALHRPGSARGGSRRIIATLGALSAFGPLSMDVYLPGLPQLSKDLSATDSAGQWTLSMCMIGLALGQLVAGPASDRWGRRVPLVVGVSGFTAFSLLCALAPSVEMLIVFRLLQGLCGAAGIVIARAIVRDLYSGAEAARVFSILVLVSSIAPVIGPLLGSVLMQVTDWRGTFVFLAMVGLVLTGAAALLPETNSSTVRGGDTRPTVFSAVRTLIRSRTFLVYALTVATGSCALFVYIAMSPYVVQSEYGWTATQFAILFAVNSIGIVALGQLNAYLLHRGSGVKRMLYFGVGVLTLGAAILLVGALTDSALGLVLTGLFLVTSSMGMILPNGTALALEDFGHIGGSASAILGCLQFLLGAVIPPIVTGDSASGQIMAVTIAVSASAVLALSVTTLVLAHRRRIRTPVAEPATTTHRPH